MRTTTWTRNIEGRTQTWSITDPNPEDYTLTDDVMRELVAEGFECVEVEDR